MYDFTREGWVRQYRYESAEHKAKPLLCRGLRDYLLRLANQQNGVLVANCSSPDKAIETLLAGAGAHPEEWDLARKYLEVWIADGYLAITKKRGRVTPRTDQRYGKLRPHADPRYGIVIKNFVRAQNARTPGAVRQKRYRDNKKGDKRNGRAQLPLPTDPVTRDATSNGQQPSPETSPVTGKERKKERQKERKKDPLVSLARQYLQDPEAAARAAGRPQTWPAVKEVLGHCDDLWGGRTRIRSEADPRLQTLVERFAEGYTPGDLKLALDGSRHSEFIQDRTELQNVKTLLKDAAAVDKYVRLATELPGVAGPAPRVQPADGTYYAGDSWGNSTTTPTLDPDDPFQEAADG